MQAGDDTVPYDGLGPDTVLTAVESAGPVCDGRLLPLNSYENRVYQVGIEDQPPLVVKFYRPGRWSDEAILEEHAFALELLERDIPMVAPLVIGGRTLHNYEGFRFTLYPRRGGRLPDLDMPDHRLWMGRFLGRIHAVGASGVFHHRPELSIQRFGREPFEDILSRNLVPGHVLEAYTSVVDDVLVRVEAAWARARPVPMIRLHGDCHAGNVLWTDTGPHFVDLDDALTGPPLQDLWMLLSGDRREMTEQLSEVLEGYEDFCAFDRRQLHLLEALRTLRMLHFSAWLARRWHDPAFPQAFPWFAESRYWEEQVLAMREQAALLDEHPLQV